jgi:hypothetical protein
MIRIKLRLLQRGAIVVFLLFFSCRKSDQMMNGSISTADTTLTDSSIIIDVTIDGKRTLGIYQEARVLSGTHLKRFRQPIFF